MKYYKRWIGDYMKDTAHLNLMDHGAYAVLLDIYYANGLPLPASHKVLYRMAGCQDDDEKSSVSRIADEFFPICKDDGLRHNCRADREIREAIDYAIKQSAKAAARWQKT